MLLTRPQPWWGSHHLHLPRLTWVCLASQQRIASDLPQPHELSLFTTMEPPDPTGSLTEDPAPPTDNFYSPANFAFYSRQPYEPLDRSSHTIRLLAVTKDEFGQLQCTLRDGIPLADADDTYTAISYCAGDPKKTRSIMVNGLPFNAFANLAHAIEETYRYRVAKHGDVEVLLWTDQICIIKATLQRDHIRSGSWEKSTAKLVRLLFACLQQNTVVGLRYRGLRAFTRTYQRTEMILTKVNFCTFSGNLVGQMTHSFMAGLRFWIWSCNLGGQEHG
jgi:hypothetical protein